MTRDYVLVAEPDLRLARTFAALAEEAGLAVSKRASSCESAGSPHCS